jgi:23S rRNA pseudouridine1911/1915/1917 synthase
MSVSDTDNDHEALIPNMYIGQRLDHTLTALFPQFSRSRLQNWLARGNLLVDGQIIKPKTKVLGGEQVIILDAMDGEESAFRPEDIPLEVMYEDDSLAIINKCENMVVHPGSGNWSGTMLNGILFRYPNSKNIPRAGIVHRLDKNTTGLMVVAKSLEAQVDLVRQLQSKSVRREYFALVNGRAPAKGTIDQPIGRHPRNRTKMAIVTNGKNAVTHFTSLDGGDGWSALSCLLETGRTHQIRVHLTSIGHPLLGDKSYTGNTKRHAPLLDTLSFQRQALHAKRLTLTHPNTGELMNWCSEIPEDLQSLLTALKVYNDEKT